MSVNHGGGYSKHPAWVKIALMELMELRLKDVARRTQGVYAGKIKIYDPYTTDNDFHLVVKAKWENYHGIMRNQLIIGLSRAVIVIHAESKSGTLNTGYTALKAAIPLLALSPDSFSIKPVGNIELIENGAIEVSDMDQINLQLIRIRNEPKKFGGNNSQIQNRLPL